MLAPALGPVRATPERPRRGGPRRTRSEYGAHARPSERYIGARTENGRRRRRPRLADAEPERQRNDSSSGGTPHANRDVGPRELRHASRASRWPSVATIRAHASRPHRPTSSRDGGALQRPLAGSRASRAATAASARRSTATAPSAPPRSTSSSSSRASTRRRSRSSPTRARWSSPASAAGPRCTGRVYQQMEIDYGRFTRQVALGARRRRRVVEGDVQARRADDRAAAGQEAGERRAHRDSRQIRSRR